MFRNILTDDGDLRRDRRLSKYSSNNTSNIIRSPSRCIQQNHNVIINQIAATTPHLPPVPKPRDFDVFVRLHRTFEFECVTGEDGHILSHHGLSLSSVFLF